jgi:hypothetical protein
MQSPKLVFSRNTQQRTNKRHSGASYLYGICRWLVQLVTGYFRADCLVSFSNWQEQTRGRHWVCCRWSTVIPGFHSLGSEFLHPAQLSKPTTLIKTTTKTPWPESASELYRPSDRRLLKKLVPSFVDRGCHVVSVTDLYGCILCFLDRSL